MAVAVDHRQEHASSELRAGIVAKTQHGVLRTAKLVEQEQRVVASALELAVVGGALLVSIDLTDRAVHVENEFIEGCRW